MASKNDKLRVIDQKPAITGGSALITQEEVIAPPAIGNADAPTDLVLVGQTIFNSSAAPAIAVSIAWNIPPNSNPTYYVIEYGKQSDYDSGTDTFDNPTRERANQESATLYLEPDTDYYIRVKAVYLAVQSPYTDFLSVHTIEDDTPPPDVTSLVAAFTNSNLVIDWDNPESYAFKDARVRIWNAGRTVLYATYYTAAGKFIWTAEENIRVTSGNPATSVSVDVTSRSYSNTLGNAVITSAVAPLPSTPSGITSTWDTDVGLADESVIVSWLASDNAFSYDLTFNNHPATPYTTTDLSFNYAHNLNINDHVPTLASGNYSLVYRIRAKDKLHQQSAIASGTITNQAPPAGIMSLTALGGFSTIGAIVALASGILDFDHFKWTVNNGVTDVQTFNSFTNDVIVSNLTSGTYSISVKAVDKFNRESAAKTVSGIVLDALTIDELRAEAVYSDDRGTSVTLLNRLKDGDDSTGVSFSYVAGNHWVKVSRALLDRYKTISFRYNTNATPTELLGYFELNDGTTSVYFAGPVTVGSAGQYTLTKYTTLGAVGGNELDLSYTNTTSIRFQLPEITEARNIYFRYNAQPDTFTLYDFYPRRLVQSDDIDVEAIRAINISVGAVNANHISVVTLSAIQTSTGTLVINTGGYIRSGQTAYNTGTGFWIGNDAGLSIPKISIGSSTNALLWDGSSLTLKFGSGGFLFDSTGLYINTASSQVYTAAKSITFKDFNVSDKSISFYSWRSSTVNGLDIRAYADNGRFGKIDLHSHDSTGSGKASLYILGDNTGSGGVQQQTISLEAGIVNISGVTTISQNTNIAGMLTVQDRTEALDTIVVSGYTSVPASGAHLELGYSSNTGWVTAYDRTAATYKALTVRGNPITLRHNGATDVLKSVSTGVELLPTDGNATFGIDMTGAATLSVANNGTSNITAANNFSGLILINDPSSSGATGLFLVGGGAGIVLVSQSNANGFSITSGTASKTNVYLDGSNRVTIENKKGVTVTYRIFTIRMRANL